MTIEEHLVKASGYIALNMFEDAWNELEEIESEERLNPQVLSLRLSILKGLEKWDMGAEIARGAVNAFPDSVLLYVLGAYHVHKAEGLEEAQEFMGQGRDLPDLEGQLQAMLEVIGILTDCYVSHPPGGQ